MPTGVNYCQSTAIDAKRATMVKIKYCQLRVVNVKQCQPHFGLDRTSRTNTNQCQSIIRNKY
eukprot:10224444-Lingulodinium_polyedra.AAC.1